MNRLLHRNHQKEIKQKTDADFCIRTGKKMEEETNQKEERILSQNGFDGTSGKLTGKATPEIRKGSKKFQKQKEVKTAISAWNASHAEPDEQIKKHKHLLEIPEKTVSISADEIGVRHQKGTPHSRLCQISPYLHSLLPHIPVYIIQLQLKMARRAENDIYEWINKIIK
ncbi:MAG: hypothetical protein V3G42_12445 [Oscillospiraceae bacterium]